MNGLTGRASHACGFLALLLVASSVHSQITDWQKPDAYRGESVDPAAVEKAKEEDYVAPPLPRHVDWQEFYLNASTRNRYFVARDPLTIGTDGAIRYIVKIVSSSGSENISAEGMRCANAERRIYATLRKDGEWSQSRGSRWVPIGDANRLNSYAFILYMGHMCDDGVAVQPTRVLETLAASFTARTGTPLTGYR